MLSSLHLVLGALLLASTAVNAAPSSLEARQRQCLLLPCTPEPGECPRGTVSLTRGQNNPTFMHRYEVLILGPFLVPDGY
jgi:hypothetical protein